MGRTKLIYWGDGKYSSPGIEYGELTGDYYPAADYEALEAKLSRLVEAAEDVKEGFDEYWESLFPERVKKLKAAIEAAKVKPNG